MKWATLKRRCKLNPLKGVQLGMQSQPALLPCRHMKEGSLLPSMCSTQPLYTPVITANTPANLSHCTSEYIAMELVGRLRGSSAPSMCGAEKGPSLQHSATHFLSAVSAFLDTARLCPITNAAPPGMWTSVPRT